MTDALDALAKLGRPTEKTREYHANEASPRTRVVYLLADAALAERTASDLAGWQEVARFEVMWAKLHAEVKRISLETEANSSLSWEDMLAEAVSRQAKEETP